MSIASCTPHGNHLGNHRGVGMPPLRGLPAQSQKKIHYRDTNYTQSAPKYCDLKPDPPRWRSRMPARIPSRGERTIVQRAKAPSASLLDEQLFDNLTRLLATAHVAGRGLPQKPIRQGQTPDSLLNRCRQQPTCVTYHAYHAYHAPFPSQSSREVTNFTGNTLQLFAKFSSEMNGARYQSSFPALHCYQRIASILFFGAFILDADSL